MATRDVLSLAAAAQHAVISQLCVLSFDVFVATAAMLEWHLHAAFQQLLLHM
jgi:hypothetical protein